MAYGNREERGNDRPSMPTLVIGLLVALFMIPTIHFRMAVDAPVWASAVMYFVALLFIAMYVVNICLRIRDGKKGHS